MALTSLLDAPAALLTTSARAAIALALEQIGVRAGEEVAMPAYHCLAMRAPVEAIGATPVFVRSNAQLDLDIDHLRSLITPRTRAVIAVHFFGFPQSLERVRELCDTHGITLIEDCAHAYYGPNSGARIGQTGDFTVGSLMKFFPMTDGGCLVSFRRPLAPSRFTSRGLLSQAKSLVNLIEQTAAWSNSRALGLVSAALGRATAAAKGARPGLAKELAAAAPTAASGSLDFQPEWVHARMSAVSRTVLRFADHTRNAERRRAHYLRYAAGLARVNGGRAFAADLPDGVVPYVFPFLLSDPSVSFASLKRAGVPMYRWEDVAGKACDTARHYQTELVQFPCHQSLKNEEVDLLIRTIIEVLAEVPAASAPAERPLPTEHRA